MGQGAQGPEGPEGPEGPRGADGKNVNLSDVISSTQFKSDIQNALIKDQNFKNVITEYFKNNATLFKGENGITEFSKLTDAEKASVVTILVKNNITIFASQLAADQTFKDSIIATLKTMTEFKGAPGKDGVTEDILKPKVMWCADGNICNVPTSATGIQLSNKIMQFGDSSIYATKFKDSAFSSGNLNINAKENIQFRVGGNDIFSINNSGFNNLKSSDLYLSGGTDKTANIYNTTDTLKFDFYKDDKKNDWVSPLTLNKDKISGTTFEGNAFGNRDGSAFKTGYGGFQTGYLKDANDLSKGWMQEAKIENDKAVNIDVVNSLSRDGLTINRGDANIKSGNVLAKSLKLQNLAKNKNGSITVSDAGNMNFVSPGNYYFKTSGKETTWFNDDGITTSKLSANDITTSKLSADAIGYKDNTQFKTGWGGFETGYNLKNDGTYDGNNQNTFDREGLTIRKGGLKIADWLIWQNGDGNLEFKHEKNGKWATFKKEGGWSPP